MMLNSCWAVFGSLLFTFATASPVDRAVSARSSQAIDGTQLSPLSTSSRWIVDSNGKRVKLRCANLAGHLETLIPEGLSNITPAQIASYLASNGFNCMRLTYSIDMALAPTTSIQQSFSNAASETGANLTGIYQDAVSVNPWIANSTVIDAFSQVVTALADQGIRVILDNMVSKASWCCSTTDGNGWWASASGYDAANSQYFDTNNWLQGLKAMAQWSTSYPNIVGMSLRNELRAAGGQDQNNHADWYNLTSLGAQSISSGNSDLLITFGGVNYDTELGYLYNTPLNKNAWAGANKTVYEAHLYNWSAGDLSDCNTLKSYAGDNWGYLLAQGEPYTGPLWLSEFGVQQSGGSDGGLQPAEHGYLQCLAQYMQSNDADWAYWALQGSYYVRQGAANSEETYGLLTADWKQTRNPAFAPMLGSMWNVTQGP